ncbi:hypothetical protein [Scale drop disease virus]|uniref:ORF_062R n=1 Tax=Scale drop disease virus TaxID=1697349 RepID=A0A0K1L684_9VIRU|nr:ORF_062R [Scale drop disease virus]AKU37477.1 ORF_062R [Scale drop disease virus]QLI60732.1 hypothetical protein [Scale drop disease virus]QXJ13650.1 ORF062R [Scale drop disease virus]UNH60724.1 hypothetical protein SDDV_ORF055 [Scale drop disease virus]
MFYLLFIIISCCNAQQPLLSGKVFNKTHVQLDCTINNTLLTNGTQLLWFNTSNNFSTYVYANQSKYVLFHQTEELGCCISRLSICTKPLIFMNNTFVHKSYISMQWTQGNKPQTELSQNCLQDSNTIANWYTSNDTWTKGSLIENADNLTYTPYINSNCVTVKNDSTIMLNMTWGCSNNIVYKAEMQNRNTGKINHICYIWSYFQLANSINGTLQCGGLRGKACRLTCMYVLNENINPDHIDFMHVLSNNTTSPITDKYQVNNTVYTYGFNAYFKETPSFTCALKSKTSQFVEMATSSTKMCNYTQSVMLTEENNCDASISSCKYVCHGNGKNCGITSKTRFSYAEQNHAVVLTSSDEDTLSAMYISRQIGPLTIKCEYDDFSVSKTLSAPTLPFQGITMWKTNKYTACCKGNNIFASVDNVPCNKPDSGLTEVCCYTNTTIACQSS